MIRIKVVRKTVRKNENKAIAKFAKALSVNIGVT